MTSDDPTSRRSGISPLAAQTGTDAHAVDGTVPRSRAIPQAAIEAALARVLESRIFRRSIRHRRFLEYVVRAALAGDADRTKELIVGIEVFGRSTTTFDPRADPIVRVEAGRLRDKLYRYYLDEGREEHYEIEIPVGSYLPRFRLRRPRDADRSRSGSRFSIAIVAFDNLSGHPDDETFCVGMADQLIDALSRYPGRKVVARHSTLKARSDRMDLARMGKALGVTHVLAGILERSGDRVRCTVRLSRASDEVALWSERFERDASDHVHPFDFQDRIAATAMDAIFQIGEISARTRGGDRDEARAGRTPTPPTSHVEARDLFERARYLARARSIEGCGKAIGYLQRAVALDPTFAAAFTELGSATYNLAALTLAPTFPSFSEAQRAAQRARELDPEDGEARALLASIAFRIERNWMAAEPMFLEALRFAPQSPTVHLSFANCLVYNGRFAEGMEHARRARQLDPLNLGVRSSVAALATFAGQHDSAIRQFDEVLELEPEHFFSLVMLGIAYFSSGDPAAARALMERACELAPHHATPRFGRIGSMALCGDLDSAARELDQLLRDLDGRHYSRFNLAVAYAALGDADAMFRNLDHAADVHDILFVTLPVHAMFDPYRSDPRYAALLERTGLHAV